MPRALLEAWQAHIVQPGVVDMPEIHSVIILCERRMPHNAVLELVEAHNFPTMTVERTRELGRATANLDEAKRAHMAHLLLAGSQRNPLRFAVRVLPLLTLVLLLNPGRHKSCCVFRRPIAF